MILLRTVLCFLLLNTRVQMFEILPGDFTNHLEITEQAILNTTLQTCRALAQAEGTTFTMPTQPFTATAVAAACGTPQSSKTFRVAISYVQLRNVRVDIRYALNANFHFDEETFVGGKRIITDGLAAVKASNKKDNYISALGSLGELLHPLQDFYSHSNWVELGNTVPNQNLIRADSSIGTVADKNRATCRNCDGNDCKNNILDDIIAEKILTSGYFGLVPLLSTKPAGKCSHGGFIDQTSKIAPKGGINKDKFSSSHGHLHTQAANIAIAATSQLLEDIRKAAGDKSFLQMVGISKGSGKALCFVTDTTESMSDDIAVVKTVTSEIISSKVGTDNEPSVYILVPFNDPGFGPLTRTTDPAQFKSTIDSLSTSGGGDNQEMSLSGLQLALSSAPFNSEVFLFTDAPAKDKELKNTVIALIERTQTVVNFMITDSIVTNRRKRSNNKRSLTRLLAESDAELYRELAQASGGLAVEVTKADLSTAVTLITQSVSLSLVTLLQAARNPGKTESFNFLVDDSVSSVTVYVTGTSVTVAFTSPAGSSESSLVTSSQSVGNLQILKLQKQVGQWKISLTSTNPYTLRVIGQSSIDFAFDFVTQSEGVFGGFDVLDTRPNAGSIGNLLLSVTGSDAVTVTEVALVQPSQETLGTVVSQGSGNYLVQIDSMPLGEFVVRVRGRLEGSSNEFQRQSSTNFRASNLTVTADTDSILIPGTPLSVPFTVTTTGSGGNVTIRPSNNQGFAMTSPTVLFLESGNSTNGTVTLSAPLNTPSGTDIVLTIEAEAPDGADINYIMLRLSVQSTVTDFTPPICQLSGIQSNCSENCSLSSSWAIKIRVTDGDDGVGVERVSLTGGNGTMSTSLEAGNANVTLVTYTASCCQPDLELLVVDRVGNVDSCVYNERDVSASSRILQTLFLLGFVLMGSYLLTEYSAS